MEVVGVEKMDRENKGRREGSLNNKTKIEEMLKQRKKNQKITINENSIEKHEVRN